MLSLAMHPTTRLALFLCAMIVTMLVFGLFWALYQDRGGPTGMPDMNLPVTSR